MAIELRGRIDETHMPVGPAFPSSRSIRQSVRDCDFWSNACGHSPSARHLEGGLTVSRWAAHVSLH